MRDVREINRDIMNLRNSGQSVKGVSDGHHTFGDYIDMRNVYFIALCNAYSDIAWKSKKHFDEEHDPIAKFNGCFIAGINTPEGQVTQHLKMKYWERLIVPEIPNAPEYDGYTEKDMQKRIISLNRSNR